MAGNVFLTTLSKKFENQITNTTLRYGENCKKKLKIAKNQADRH